jgi:hypothetical protein
VFVADVTLEKELWKIEAFKEEISKKIDNKHPTKGAEYIKNLDNEDLSDGDKHPFKIALNKCTKLRKGELAQQLAWKIKESKDNKKNESYDVPEYISKAISKIKDMTGVNNV